MRWPPAAPWWRKPWQTRAPDSMFEDLEHGGAAPVRRLAPSPLPPPRPAAAPHARSGRRSSAEEAGTLLEVPPGKPDEPEAPEPDAAVSLAQARSQLESVLLMLLRPSPAVLENCEDLLSSAARNLEASRPAWAAAGRGRLAAEEARRLRRIFEHVRRLLDNAADFFARWQGIRAAMTAGYQADGAPGHLRGPSRIFLAG